VATIQGCAVTFLVLDEILFNSLCRSLQLDPVEGFLPLIAKTSFNQWVFEKFQIDTDWFSACLSGAGQQLLDVEKTLQEDSGPN